MCDIGHIGAIGHNRNWVFWLRSNLGVQNWIILVMDFKHVNRCKEIKGAGEMQPRLREAQHDTISWESKNGDKGVQHPNVYPIYTRDNILGVATLRHRSKT